MEKPKYKAGSASTDPVTVDNNGNVTLHYRDGSSTTLDATNVINMHQLAK
ncbi:hypothetical protein ACVPOS_11900 [Staphylococcus aureus]